MWWSRWCCCRGRSHVHFELWSGRRRWSRESESWPSLCWSRCTHSLHCPHLNPEGHNKRTFWWLLSHESLWDVCASMYVNVHEWVYLVIVSELVLQDVSVGPVWLRPWESDGVWGTAQLVHHGNCTGNCGRWHATNIWGRLMMMIDQVESSYNCEWVKLCWSDTDHMGAALQRIFNRAWKWSGSFYGEPSRIWLQSLRRLAGLFKGNFWAFHSLNQ